MKILRKIGNGIIYQFFYLHVLYTLKTCDYTPLDPFDGRGSDGITRKRTWGEAVEDADKHINFYLPF